MVVPLLSLSSLPPSSSPTSARRLPSLPPCFLFSLSLPLAPPLSAHLSSSRLPGGLAPPPSYSMSPAFLRQLLLLLTSRLLMASPPPPPLSASTSSGSASSFHMVPGWVWVSRLLLGLPLPRLTRLLCVCCSRSRLRVASLSPACPLCAFESGCFSGSFAACRFSRFPGCCTCLS